MGFFSSKEEYATKLVYTNNEFPLRYQIQLESTLTMNNVSYNEVITDIIWRIDKWETNENGYFVSIVSEKNETTKYPGQMKNLISFLELFNIPLSTLALQLDKQGNLIKILNQDEITHKWMLIRNNELAEYEKDDSTKAIIYGGDSDFSETLPVINNSMLYLLFLSPVYGNKKMMTPKLQVFSQDSQLFQGNNIDVIVDETIQSISNIDIRLEHIGSGKLQDQSKAQEIFKESYKHLADSPFNYGYHIKAKYKYNTNGILDICLAEIKEQANDLIYSKQTYKIKLIK